MADDGGNAQTLIEQAQAPPLVPPQHPPPPPATAFVSPLADDENDTNTDSWRFDSSPQLGHGASSSMRLTGRRRSNVCEHDVHVNS